MLIYSLPVLAYLFGSISTAVVVAKAMGLADPRQVGSGNPGATNILRYGGKLAAILTLLGDVLKGVIPVLLARALTADPIVIAITGFMAFVGHLFPVFFGFPKAVERNRIQIDLASGYITRLHVVRR